MFKKSEDSEWSRFSRALSGQQKATTEETEIKEEVREPAPAAREVPQPAAPPPPPPAASRPNVTQTYVRPHPPAQSESTGETETVIGLTSSIDGTITCESGLRIKGAASGEITCGKSLVIEESARVNANIKAGNAVVAGQMEGSIVCDGRLEVLASGRVIGELTATVLIIQEGAFFEGHLKMKDRQIEDKPPVSEPAMSRRLSSPSGEPVVN